MFVPRTPEGLAADGISIPNPSEVCLVIFLHGSEAEEYPDHCVPEVSPEGTVPPVIGSLSGELVASKPILVFAPCSKVIPGLRFAPEQYKVRQRAVELTALLQRFEGSGYLRPNIIMAGHSAGAWIALTALARTPGLFGGVIGFAPAFAGRRSGQDESNPFWVTERASQKKVLQAASFLPSLIYAFESDEFESQGSLRTIFKNVPDATFIEMSKMPAKMYDGATAGAMYHNGAYHASFVQQKARILRFIEDRIANSR